MTSEAQSSLPGRGEALVPAARANPEKSGLVKAYRRLLPESTRRAIAQRVSVETRGALMQHMASSLDLQQRGQKLRGKVLQRRYAAHLDEALPRVVLVDGKARIALVDPAPTPQAARADALALVCTTFEHAGIDHFCVRTEPGQAPSVAVSAADRGRVQQELARLCRRIPGYAAPVDREGVPGTPHAGFVHTTWRRLQSAPVTRVTWYRTIADGELVLGQEHGCDIEYWKPEDGPEGPWLVAPRRNVVTAEVPAAAAPVDAPAELFTGPLALGGEDTAAPHRTVHTRPEFTIRLPQDIPFPIDVVYTWVDGADPAWAERRSRALRAAGGSESHHEEAVNAARFLSRDELKYSLRSLHQYAPWVRKVFLVTDDQTPAWLDTSHPGIQVVSHKEIFSDPKVLPTFNSHAIESQLHHIEGLSEHFLYFNDDVFLGNPLTPQTFFLSNGLTKFFLSPALVPLGDRSPADAPVAAAAKNNRALVEERFATTLTQKMRHVPHALRRSMLDEIEERYAEAHAATAAARFRSPDDLSVASSLHHYYAYHQGRAIPSDLRYMYMDLAHPNTSRRLNRLLANRDLDIFCINDTVSTEKDLQRTDALIRPFLEGYFPVPSPFEKHAG
ncbi:stealth family protein [Streptomyces morookaense]|uniref:Stealth conserved region 3 domain-containing protein n=1 Tax=Streptomyces morookaense TaxID=1970 RepID=A0A7Y7B459_STRMO|nr:stealth family protein [Streptomyces morookaense]NVK78550.1 stealth conserved region 3 domain-containing protein [Streptomyces morookaense]